MGFSIKLCIPPPPPPPLRVVGFPGGIKSRNSEIPGGLRLRIVGFPQGMGKQAGNSKGLTHNNMKFHGGKKKISGISISIS